MQHGSGLLPSCMFPGRGTIRSLFASPLQPKIRSTHQSQSCVFRIRGSSQSIHNVKNATCLHSIDNFNFVDFIASISSMLNFFWKVLILKLTPHTGRRATRARWLSKYFNSAWDHWDCRLSPFHRGAGNQKKMAPTSIDPGTEAVTTSIATRRHRSTLATWRSSSSHGLRFSISFSCKLQRAGKFRGPSVMILWASFTALKPLRVLVLQCTVTKS